MHLTASMSATLLILTLAACASHQPPAASVVSSVDPDAPVCHREVPTGSNQWHTVCVRPSSDAEKQRAVTDLQDKVQHSPATKAGTTLGNN